MANDSKKTDSKAVKPKVAAKDSVKAKKAPAQKNDKPLISEIKASARFIHMSPKKVRLVIDQVRGQNVTAALNVLRFINKGAVGPVVKLINSAVANADHNFQISVNDLFIKKFTADDGPVIKRFMPRARGSSAAIRKRTSHIHLILGVLAGAKKKAGGAESKAGRKAEEVKVVSPDEIKKNGPKNTGMGGSDSGRKEKGFIQGMFQRKTG